jgi:hypothetical protein
MAYKFQVGKFTPASGSVLDLDQDVSTLLGDDTVENADLAGILLLTR